jgi:hypothetical protein
LIVIPALSLSRAAGISVQSRHQLQRLVHRAQHVVELMAALDDQPGRRDHAVGALLAREPGILLDAIKRDFGRAAEHRKHRTVSEKIDRVIAPFAGCHHAPVKAEDAVEFAPAEGDFAGDAGLIVDRAPALLARVGFAESHAAPP